MSFVFGKLPLNLYPEGIPLKMKKYSFREYFGLDKNPPKKEST